MKNKQKITVTYEPDNTLKNGYLLTFHQIYQELTENKWLMYQLFKRDFTAMYKQSFIGILWIFIMPIINVAIFAMLGKSGIFNYGNIAAPYPLYAILGVSLWQIFNNGIMACGGALASAGDMITRINFSKKSLVMAAMGRSFVTFLIQLLMVAALLVIYKVVPSSSIVFLPLIALPIVLMTLGFGLVISILNSIVRDTGNLLSVLLMLGMYGTPVLYAKPATGILANITNYNPMYYFIASGRDMVLTGSLSEPEGFILSTIFACFVFIAGLFIFHLTETRITERM